jgi:hypothetical protein
VTAPAAKFENKSLQFSYEDLLYVISNKLPFIDPNSHYAHDGITHAQVFVTLLARSTLDRVRVKSFEGGRIMVPGRNNVGEPSNLFPLKRKGMVGESPKTVELQFQPLSVGTANPILGSKTECYFTLGGKKLIRATYDLSTDHVVTFLNPPV